MSNPAPSEASARPGAGKRCALCGKPVAAMHAPFCSAGCRDRDLLNWLGESYRVPAAPSAWDDDPDTGPDDAPAGLDSAPEPPL